MEMLTGFMVGLFFSWYIWPILLILVFVCEMREVPGWSFFFNTAVVLGLITVYNKLSNPIGFHWWYSIVYLVIGFGYSCWRYLRYVEKKLKNTDSSLKWNESMLSPSEHTGKIICWLMYWPTSFICYLGRDIYDLLEKVINKYLIQVYQNLLNYALKDLKAKELDKAVDKINGRS